MNSGMVYNWYLDEKKEKLTILGDNGSVIVLDTDLQKEKLTVKSVTNHKLEDNRVLELQKYSPCGVSDRVCISRTDILFRASGKIKQAAHDNLI